MSHSDPLFDPDNSYEDDDMNHSDDVDPSNYDDYNDFHDEDDRKNHFDDFDDYSPEFDYDDYDDSMDGDHESALGSAGWGEDEYYGYYGEDY
jgi:hypothetical protein